MDGVGRSPAQMDLFDREISRSFNLRDYGNGPAACFSVSGHGRTTTLPADQTELARSRNRSEIIHPRIHEVRKNYVERLQIQRLSAVSAGSTRRT